MSRPLATAVALAAALTLVACSSETPAPGPTTPAQTTAAPPDAAPSTTAAPTTTAPTTTTSSATSSTTSTTTSVTTTSSAAGSTTATTSSPSTSSTTSPGSTTSDEPSATTDDAAGTSYFGTGECSTGAYSTGPLRLGDAPELVGTVGRALLGAAMACDAPALISFAQQDQTVLGGQSVSAEEALGMPDVEGRYIALAALLSRTDPVEFADGQWLWPAAAGPQPTEADWAQLEAAELFSVNQLAAMRAAGSYSGWRVVITDDGTWAEFSATG